MTRPPPAHIRHPLAPICRIHEKRNFKLAFLHIFGDSHAIFYGNLPLVKIHHLGAVTMHRVGRDGISFFDFAARGVGPQDDLAFVFGEIDIRVHIGAQRDKNFRDPDEMISDLSKNYITVLNEVQDAFPESRIYVMSSVPPAGLNYPNFDQSLPRNGNDAERANWAKELNSSLKYLSQSSRLIYVDQHSPFCDDDGLLDLAVSGDGVHIDMRFIEKVDLPRA